MIPIEAVSQVTLWKNESLRKYAVAFIKTGLDLLSIEMPFFGSDDLPENVHEGNIAIPGIAVMMLEKAGIIIPYYGTNNSLEIFGGRRKSKIKASHGRKVNIYQIRSQGLAQEFLRRNMVDVEPIQENLFKSAVS